MTYTTTPLPPIDTINYHGGFYAYVVLMTIVVVIQFLVWEDKREVVKLALGVVLSYVIAGLISYNTGEYKTYANTPVSGELAGFVAEGYSHEVHRHKSNVRRADVHMTYVVYKINGGDVLFPAQTGIQYPQRAIFYRN